MDDLEHMELSGSEIAIIGMAGRFPGAQNIEQFWQNICQGIESLTVLTDQELAASGVWPEEYDDPNYVRVARILDNEDLFDASFFGYTPLEASVMDPQQRLFLECTREALENAGYAPEMIDVPVGVFGGSKTNTYLLNLFNNRQPAKPLDIVQITVGNDLAGLTTHVSHKLNLTGPSYAFHTHCSTSLVAIHLACQSLLLNECQMALAGGVAVDVPQRKGYLYKPVDIFSPDGRCRAFDARARGFIFGNGIGVVVLKRLEDALQDRDEIYAVIKGSATNNDGSAKASYTAPGVDGQANVVAEALANAEVAPETISYIETHGTGTPLGDAIEIRALSKVFGHVITQPGSIALGSVKTNVGHLGAAAGVTGLIKTALALKHRVIPPSLNFEQPHPDIPFADSPFYVNVDSTAWQAQPVRRAGVSSFGFGSTNAHVVMEEAPALPDSEPAQPWQLLVLSAKTAPALDAATHDLAQHLRQQPTLNLADVAYTLQVGRTPFKQRRILVCRDVADALAVLDSDPTDRLLSHMQPADTPSTVLMFPGVGDQYVGMARELYQTEPVLREQIDLCAGRLQPLLGCDIREILFADSGSASATQRDAAPGAGPRLDMRKMLRRSAPAEDPTTQMLQRPSVGHAIVFAVEYALAQLWRSWGVEPDALIGYSLGEYAAACVAGVLSLDDSLRLVVERGKMIESVAPGAMLAVLLAEDELKPLLSERRALAITSAPQFCVVAGDPDALAELQTTLAERGTICQYLPATHALHSRAMEPIKAALSQLVRGMTLHAPQIPYISNLTGTWITAEQATDPEYWAAHLCQTVRFSEGIRELLRTPGRIFIEAGPGETLSALVKQHVAGQAERWPLSVPSLRHAYDQQDDRAYLLQSVGQLWLAGVVINWAELHSQQRRRVALPTYPFQRQRYWIEPQAEAATAPVAAAKESDLSRWFYIPSWRRTMPPLGEPSYPRRWLIFSNATSLETKLVQRLRERGDQVITVLAGGEFAGQDETYTVQPGRRADYDALQASLHQRNLLPSNVVHLWNTLPLDSDAPDATQPALDRSFHSLVCIAQIIADQNITTKLHLAVVSSNVQKVTSDEIVQPLKATLIGPCKVIPRELPNIACCNIDIVLPPPDSTEEDHLLTQLIAECEAGANDEVIAYRGYDRWVQTYEAAPLPPIGDAPNRMLRDGGVYLITGGLGGIGLVLAEYLVRAVRARLVLTTRSAFPATETWDNWIATHPPHDNISQRIKKLLALTALGAELLIVQADVSDLAAMQSAVAAAHARFGAIHGAIHAAGLPGGGLIRFKTPEAAAAVMQPKVQGTQVLATALKDSAPDFIVLCSSILSFVAPLGQVDYCAANAFLDAFAQANRDRGLLTVSINWDVWHEVGFWDSNRGTDSGDELRLPLQQFLQEQFGQGGLQPQQGVEAFGRILHRNRLPQIIVCTQDLARLTHEIAELTLPRVLAANPALEDGTPRHQRPNLRNEFVAPRDEIETKLAELWQHLLGVDTVGAHDNFFDLGGHSLLMTQLRNRLVEQLQIELPISSLFENARLSDMAELIKRSATQPSATEEPIAQQLQTVFPTQRQSVLETYLRHKIAQTLNIAPGQIVSSGELAPLKLDLIALVDLMWTFKRDLNIHYYPPEIGAQRSIATLATTLLHELDRGAELERLATNTPLTAYTIKPFRADVAPTLLLATPARKNKSMVFLHSSPRSGSTILRVMLAGHPDIFCPPEINLLPYLDMQDWKAQIGYSEQSRWPAQGLHAALTELLNLRYEEGWSLLNQIVSENRSVQQVYAQLQEAAGTRLLIDKTPVYWRDLDVLRRGETLFEAPKYIFLARHPYATIESILRMRLDRLLSPDMFVERDLDPYVVAERIWAEANGTLLRFVSEIEPERYRLVRFEDVTSRPAEVMHDLCAFLGLPFNEALLNPYDNKSDRMIGGLGDPNILEHKQIDPKMGEVWKRIRLPRALHESTRHLAAQFGYELPNEPTTAPADPIDEAALNLDQLTDEQVSALLSRLMSENKQA